MKRTAVAVYLCFWSALASIPLASSMAWHQVPLPAPAPEGIPVAKRSGQWLVVHVLTAACPCSRSVANHLSRRQLLPDAEEVFYLLGDDTALQNLLIPTGILPGPADSEQLRQLGISGGPCMIIFDPEGMPRYCGGYCSAPPTELSTFEDQTIYEELRSGQTPRPRPVFGCSTSAELNQYFDPFHLKSLLYGQKVQ